MGGIFIKKFVLGLIIFTGFIALFSFGITGIGKGSKINCENKIPEFKFNAKDAVSQDVVKRNYKIKVYITKENKVKEMNIEEYVKSVVACEMPVEFNIEALKAQSVAARTFAIAHIKDYGGSKCSQAKGADVCDTTHCQVYLPYEQVLQKWPKNFQNTYWNKITAAVKSTEKQVLTYNGKLVMEPCYFSVSSGKTENSADVFLKSEPYLKSVISPGEEVDHDYRTYRTISYNSLAYELNSACPKALLNPQNLRAQIEILSRTEAGSVKKIKIGKIVITGSEFRKILGINSSNFNINFNSQNIKIICIGYGHDVGMSQRGANVMANAGKNYIDILTHYYQGVKVEKVNQ